MNLSIEKNKNLSNDHDNQKQEYRKRSTYQSANIPLLIFDIMLLPIHLIRSILIYFWGSKYNLKGFQFLDVIMHADNPYFNQEDCRMINTIGKDYRVTIRDDSRLFPIDLLSYINIVKTCEMSNKLSKIETKTNNVNIFEPIDKNKKKIKKNLESDYSDEDDSDTESNDCTNETSCNSSDSHNSKKVEIKGVNYFESNSEEDKHKDMQSDTKKRKDILESIRDELNSAFDL